MKFGKTEETHNADRSDLLVIMLWIIATLGRHWRAQLPVGIASR
jgi:hypothetical protein